MRIFQNNFSPKPLFDYLWVVSIFSVKKPNTSKIYQKYVTHVTYMLILFPLTGTPMCFRDIDFLLIKNKEIFFNKESCFVADPAGCLTIFMPNFILFLSTFLITGFNTVNFFCFKKGTIARAVFKTLSNS